MYSRRLAVEEKKNRKRAFYFSVMTVVLIAVMFLYGLPLVVKLANVVYDFKKSNEPVESLDTTPPPPPYISSLPTYTNNDRIETKGRTESGVTVTISVNDKTSEVVSDNSGGFSQTVTLKNDENTIFATARDSSGNVSQKSIPITVVLDKTPPNLTVTNPKNNDQFSGSKNTNIIVKGNTEGDAKVQINNHLAIVNSSGNFSLAISLISGSNTITISAEDPAGNKNETVLNVNYSP
jgi:hypothetical protein